MYGELYKNVRFIQLDDRLCSGSGFKNFTDEGLVTAVDKAYCYFSMLNKSYNQVWFMDDNAFIYDEETLRQMDDKFPAIDYLTGYYFNKDVKPHDSYWPQLHECTYTEHRRPIHLSDPFFKSYPIVSRLTSETMRVLREYIYRVSSGFFYEIMISTIVKQHALSYEIADPLLTVVPHGWENWTYNDINTAGVYHPVAMKLHRRLRVELAKCIAHKETEALAPKEPECKTPKEPECKTPKEPECKTPKEPECDNHNKHDHDHGHKHDQC